MPTEYPKVHTYRGRFIELPRDHVNAYVIELPSAVVVVDATLAWSSAKELRRLAESFGKPIDSVLMTHGHPDHYGGLVEFQDVPIYASQGGIDFAHREDVTKNDTASYLLGEDWPATRVFPNRVVEDGDTVTVDGHTFRFLDLGPGESDSDGAWVFEKDGVTHAFVGDSVANRTHCFFRDGHTKEWLAILDRFESEFGDNTKFYVGHGETPVGAEVIEWQRGYINTFLAAVDELEDRSVPVSEETQEHLTKVMKDYLPKDDLLFLMQYELPETLENLFEEDR